MNSLCALVLTACLFCVASKGTPVFGERDPLFHGGGGIVVRSNDPTFSILPNGSTLVNGEPYLPNGERNPEIPNLPPGSLYTSDGRVLTFESDTPFKGTTLILQEREHGGSPRFQSIIVTGQITAAAQNMSGLLIAGNFTDVGGIPRSNIAALDNNLNVTPLFGSTSLTAGYISGIVVMPDGAILIGGSSFGRAMLLRFFSDGVRDAAFAPAFVHDPASQYDKVTGVVPQPDGKLLIAESSTLKATLVRLLPDGSLDTSFHTDKAVVSAVLQSDGGIVCLSNDQCFRLNSDGTVDATFVAGPSAGLLGVDKFGYRYLKSFDANGYLFTEGVVRLFPNGEVDMNYCRTGPLGNIRAVFSEPGGSVIVAGNFQKFPFDNRSELKSLAQMYHGTTTVMDRFGKDGIARLDKTGHVTNGFELGPGEFRSVIKMEKSGSGYIVLNKFNPRLARYTLNGKIDPAFRTVTADEFVYDSYSSATFAIQDDGKILLSGHFIQFRGMGYPIMVRLNSDGSVDPTFRLTGYTSNIAPDNVVPMPDGQIYISLGWVIQRVSTNGNVDPNLSIVFDADPARPADLPFIETIVRGSGNTFWVAGNLRGLHRSPLPNVVRLSSSGGVLATSGAYLDPRPQYNYRAQGLLALSDGGLLISSGWRIRADGTTFGNFQVGGTAVTEDEGGDIIVAGGSVLFAARLYGEASATPLVLKPTTLNRWQISGYSSSQVDIESSHDLIDWRAESALNLTNGQAAFDRVTSVSNSFFRAKLRR